MAITLSEKFRMGAGGKAWRTYEITHAGAAAGSTVTAASMDLTYIEAITGVNTNLALGGTLASAIVGMLDISITANHDALVWIASTSAGYQTVSMVGW